MLTGNLLLFMKHNFVKASFRCAESRERIEKKPIVSWTVYHHLPNRGCFSSSRHSWSTIEHSTGIHGNKGKYAGKAEPKNLVSSSTKCLLVVVLAIPPLTEATLSGTRELCIREFFSLLVPKQKITESDQQSYICEKQRAINPKWLNMKHLNHCNPENGLALIERIIELMFSNAII